jgi:hypothetical protein
MVGPIRRVAMGPFGDPPMRKVYKGPCRIQTRNALGAIRRPNAIAPINRLENEIQR